MTPYQNHQALNHETTWHSPNGVDQIEECKECFAHFLHSSTIGYPLSMSPQPKYKWQSVQCDPEQQRREYSEYI